MSFYRQKLANYFPKWTKTRRDPSSVMQRLFIPFAETIANHKKTNQRISEEFHLNKLRLGKDNLGIVELEEENYIELTSGPGGGKIITYPTVSVTSYNEDIEPTRYETLEDALSSPPTRLELQEVVDSSASLETLIWSTEDEITYNDFPRASRVYIEVSNSEIYNRKTIVTDRMFTNNTEITIFGKDINLNPIKEHIKINDDGSYISKYIFSSIQKISYEGFNGDINVYWTSSELTELNDIWSIASTMENEGPLFLTYRNSESSGYLQFNTKLPLQGNEYRRPGVNVSDFEINVLISEAVLLDIEEDDIEIVSFAINPEDTYLYVLDSVGYIHIYEHKPGNFEILSLNSSLSTDSTIRIQPDNYYPSLESEDYLWTRHERLRSLVSSVIIKRISPTGVVRYLQADKSWGAVTYSHRGTLNRTNAESSWTDFRFSTTYDEIGQWEYYCIATTEDGVDTSGCAVLVDSLIAMSSLDSGLSEVVGIGFSRENYLELITNDGIVLFSIARDAYIIDTNLQRLIFVESDYSSVEVS